MKIIIIIITKMPLFVGFIKSKRVFITKEGKKCKMKIVEVQLIESISIDISQDAGDLLL